MTPEKDQVRQQIDRILDSELFHSSEVQRRLLKYLAEKSLAGEAGQLKEYTIGVEGIGRPESYDPRRDSTVRLQISKLRQKIAEYYLTAGQDDSLLIELPKGRFQLVVTSREPHAAAPARIWGTPRILAAALVAVSAAAIWLAVSLAQAKRAADVPALPPSLEEIWGPLAASGKPTLLCVGTPMFVRLMPQGYFFRDPNVNTWSDVQSSGLDRRLEREFPGTKPDPWYVFTTLGEAGGAFMLGKALSRRMPELQVANSTELSWEQIRSDNVVFIGPNRFNLQISALPVQQDFAIESYGIRNLRPRPGEPRMYEDSAATENRSGMAYALVSLLPGLHGDGHIVVLAGSGIPGTLAATEFVTSERYAEQMLKRLRTASGRLPPYYQVVIRCKYNQWLPVEINYVVHHVVTPA